MIGITGLPDYPIARLPDYPITYLLDGHLARHYPQYDGKRVRIRLDCVEEPRGDATRFVRAADHAIRAEGLEFIVKVTPPTVAEK